MTHMHSLYWHNIDIDLPADGSFAAANMFPNVHSGHRFQDILNASSNVIFNVHFAQLIICNVTLFFSTHTLESTAMSRYWEPDRFVFVRILTSSDRGLQQSNRLRCHLLTFLWMRNLIMEAYWIREVVCGENVFVRVNFNR